MRIATVETWLDSMTGFSGGLFALLSARSFLLLASRGGLVKFDRKRYDEAIKQQDEALTPEDYYAGLCALAEAQGRIPHPTHVARAEGRQAATRSEWEAWERRLGIPDIASIVSPLAGTVQRSRAWDLGVQRERSRRSAPSPTRDAETPGSVEERSPSWALPRAPERKSRAPHETLEFPRLQSAQQPVIVSFPESAWRDLCGFAYASSDGTETGGFLLGEHNRSWMQRVSVTRVTEAVEERRNGSMDLDIAAIVAEKAWIRGAEADSHFGEIGCWHTHPGVGAGEPSRADLRMWLNTRDVLDCAFYIGLILTPGGLLGERWGDSAWDPDWGRPIAHAWVVRRNDFGESVYERGQVER